jgi:hypothetical protein
MLTSCNICGKSFSKLDRKGLTKYVPNVCSSGCFFTEIEFNTPNKSHFLCLLPKEGFVIDFFKEKSNTYRSKYEERFAKWLLKYQIEFEYEPYKIEFDNKIVYVPDFYIPVKDIFIEVKGLWERESKRKVRKMGLLWDRFYLVDKEFLRLIRV